MRKMSAKRLYFFSKGRLFALTLMALLLSTSLLLGCAAPFMETAEASGKLGTLPYNPDTHEVTLPAPLLKHPFRFVAIGDTGSEASFQYDVAKEMARQHQKQPFAAVLMLGDLIYPDGNVHKHGDKAFLKPYGPLLEKNVLFMPALGNHDVLFGFQESVKSFFGMPADYYFYQTPEVAFFAIDSNTFAKDLIQQKWLERQLANTTAPWKIVYGHHPVYSSGLHLSSTSLTKTLQPILRKHPNVVYLAGHDHDYERFKPVDGVYHVVSGGGGAYLRDFTNRIVSTSLVRKKAHHFMIFQLTPDGLHFQTIDKRGKVLDQGLFEPTTDVKR